MLWDVVVKLFVTDSVVVETVLANVDSVIILKSALAWPTVNVFVESTSVVSTCALIEDI